MPDLKDMDYQQMVDYCTWESMQLLAQGTPLRNVIRDAIHTSAAWKRERDAMSATPPAAVHASDCAVHNEPAYPAGPCDCGAEGK